VEVQKLFDQNRVAAVRELAKKMQLQVAS